MTMASQNLTTPSRSIPHDQIFQSSRLKLDHSIPEFVSKTVVQVDIVGRRRSNPPLRTLFIQHTMTTLLATDLIAALQRHLRVAVSTEISHSRTVCGGAAGTVSTEGVLGAQRWDLIGFAGHFAEGFALWAFLDE